MLNGNRLKSSRRQLIAGVAASLFIVAAFGCASSAATTPDPTLTVEKSSEPAVVQVEPTATSAPSAAEVEVKDVTPTEAPISTVEPTSAPTTLIPPTATVAPEPTVALATTNTPTPTSVPQPTATPTATPDPLTNVYDRYGFTVELDQDATFASSNLNVGGWSDADPDSSQGLMTFNYNGANIVIFWQPQKGDTPQDTVDLTYQLQQLSNPALTFAALSEGDLAVDGGAGKFVGFLTSEFSGENASGGLIGAWTCPESATQVSLTATSPDSTALQIRFDRLTSGFSCATK